MNPRDLQFGRTVALLFAGMAALCLFVTRLFVVHRISSSGPIATAEVVNNFAGRTNDGILLIVERNDAGERIRVQTLHDRSDDFPTGSTVEISMPRAGIPYVNDPGTELVPILVTATGFVIAAAISLLFKRLYASRALTAASPQLPVWGEAGDSCCGSNYCRIRRGWGLQPDIGKQAFRDNNQLGLSSSTDPLRRAKRAAYAYPLDPVGTSDPSGKGPRGHMQDAPEYRTACYRWVANRHDPHDHRSYKLRLPGYRFLHRLVTRDGWTHIGLFAMFAGRAASDISVGMYAVWNPYHFSDPMFREGGWIY